MFPHKRSDRQKKKKQTSRDLISIAERCHRGTRSTGATRKQIPPLLAVRDACTISWPRMSPRPPATLSHLTASGGVPTSHLLAAQHLWGIFFRLKPKKKN